MTFKTLSTFTHVKWDASYIYHNKCISGDYMRFGQKAIPVVDKIIKSKSQRKFCLELHKINL